VALWFYASKRVNWYSLEESRINRYVAMQITLNLDEALINEAFELTNLSTQEELVNLALIELVRSRRKKNLLDLAGLI
jgi:Arc/MetJ family transcription regulator